MDRKAFIKLTGLTSIGLGMNNLDGLGKFADSLPDSGRMPVLFMGHGSPMNALEDNEFVRGFRSMAQSLPKPRAILCISAHWYVRGTMVTAMEMPRTIHDFYGFPEELYKEEYPAKGTPALARETKEILSPATIGLDEEWGLDHGTWTVLKHMYPLADVPVIQLSIDYTKPAAYHFDLAGRLKPLRDKGVPTPDHYLPMIYSLGLHQKGESVEFFNDKLLAGSLSMTSLKIS